ncbi:radical SAM protein [Ramlibacter sp. RBP-2]|uniref:Radical SAM protein n=1 Tax=Ramlibacter lithotrophicus TaxID=2606681 RepID=A0A7X6DGQ5_9BURK|nr:radical SAM protein [Ramlibacter lithotrophicus]NKE66854.1 radical SAM protein [Ramlibacter lithotrophicus]
MAVVAALPVLSEHEAALTYNITFVVPASKCNLNCPACFIKARNEVSKAEAWLSPSDYRKIITAAADRYEHLRVAIQGYEPLLPESWEYTFSILDEARAHGLSSSFVTNGTYLETRLHELISLEVGAVTVSVDSPSGHYHDLGRGALGAHAKAVSGLDKALKLPELANKMIVASMLQPHRHHYLDGMAQWLANRGAKKWVVGPMLSPRAKGTVDTIPDIFSTLYRLQSEAHAAGVKLVIDDEFSLIKDELPDKVSPLHKLAIRRLKRLERTIRFSPSGRASVGAEILGEIDHDMPRWVPAEESGDAFLERALA